VVDEDVLEFDVTMGNANAVQVLDCTEHYFDDGAGGFGVEGLFFNVLKEVVTISVLEEDGGEGARFRFVG
jgi:hypothetical protein